MIEVDGIHYLARLEVSERLTDTLGAGYRPRSIDRLINEGKLTAHRFDGKQWVYLSVPDVDAFIQARARSRGPAESNALTATARAPLSAGDVVAYRKVGKAVLHSPAAPDDLTPSGVGYWRVTWVTGSARQRACGPDSGKTYWIGVTDRIARVGAVPEKLAGQIADAAGRDAAA